MLVVPQIRTRRARVTTLAVGMAVVAMAGAGLPSPASPSATRVLSHPNATRHSSAELGVPKDVKLVRTRSSLLGVHRWYRQVANGHFVVGGWYATHYDRFSKRTTRWDGRKPVGALHIVAPRVSATRAVAVAAARAKTSAGNVVKTDLWILPPGRLRTRARLVYAVSTADGRGARTSYVDAADGRVLQTVQVADKVRNSSRPPVTGVGRVFEPNPVVALRKENLRDHNDAASAVPVRAYTPVKLIGLDHSHTLSGRYARIINARIAHSATNTYRFNRSDNRFEQTEAYYAATREQHFLQRLGFHDVNASRQRILTDAFSEDNSYFIPQNDQISLGRGGVDDAEDPEVMWHEYGHAIQADQVLDFGTRNQGRAMGEGFGDYMAVTMSQPTQPKGPSVPATACIADWDATAYTSGPVHCLRRTDTAKTYPAGLDPADPHVGGEIWSRALWDMNRSMGRADATRVIIEAQFWMYPPITMPAGAAIMVTVAHELARHGFIAAGSMGKVRTALAARHLLP
jgi:Fungalysin metallopeptidase (M36)